MRPSLATVVLVFSFGAAGCAVLGNVYSAQIEILCPRLPESGLRTELNESADRISKIVGQPVTTVIDEPGKLILNIHIPKKNPTFWWGAIPVDIRMSVEMGNNSPVFIAIYRKDNATEDEAIRTARGAVDASIKASKCHIGKNYVNYLDPI